MRNVSKILFSEQLLLSELTLSQLEHIVSIGQTVLYLDENGYLKIANNEYGDVETKNATGDTFRGVTTPDLPNTFLTDNLAYGLLAVRKGNGFKLIWGIISVDGNYNVVTGDTEYNVTIVHPQYQIYNSSTPGNYFFNGSFLIDIVGGGANAAKRYSVDGGINFSDYDSNSNYVIENLGFLEGGNINLVVQDSIEEEISNQILYLNPPDYSWDILDYGLFVPSYIEHTIFKNDDPSDSSGVINVNVSLAEENIDYEGLYTYKIYLDNTLLTTISDTPEKFVSYSVDMDLVRWNDGIFTATVTRKNSGYIQVGNLTAQSINYNPTQFLWSKNNGNSFSSTSLIEKPFLLLNENILNIIYEPSEVNGDKKVFSLKSGTNEVYQLNQTLEQVISDSEPYNESVKITPVEGIVKDEIFGTIFNSNNFFAATIIERDNENWVESVNPPYSLIDFKVEIVLLTTEYLFYFGPNTKMNVLIEDIEGNEIISQDAVFLSSSPTKGMIYEAIFEDLETTLFGYFGEIIRIRFTFNPDVLNYDPNNNIMSKLKYVKYV